MKNKTWHSGMSDKETADLAYWERNMLALFFAEGWYNDDVPFEPPFILSATPMVPRYKGWRRVLSLLGGKMTFHIPDDFDVGSLQQIEPNWDGHTTEEKWRFVMRYHNVEETK